MVWDLNTMAKLNAEQTAQSLRKKNLPLVISTEAELDRMPPFPFPNLGVEGCNRVDAMPNMKTVACLFVDKTGIGKESEPALTHRQLLSRLRMYVADGPIAVAMEEEGMFQTYVTVWRPA